MTENKLPKGPEQLMSEVIRPGWCVSCGACADLCPYIKAVGDRVAVIHPCGLADGNCYSICPRTATDYAALATAGATANPDPALGDWRRIYHARAADTQVICAGQYGGVVSALALFLLKNRECDAAVLTGSDGLYPRWKLARSEAEVLAAAGSKYGVCPSLAGVNRALGLAPERLAVVGRPCQVVALRKMQYYSSVVNRDKIQLVLGLFCFWGLDYTIYRFLAKEGVNKIIKADVPKDEGLSMETDQGNLKLSQDETRAFIRTGCYSCIDPTSELADLSIGSTEADSSWCALIVRTEAGEALVEKAAASGVLQLREPTEGTVDSLRNAALSKKRRVLAAEGTESGHSVNTSYLQLAEEDRRRIMEMVDRV